jgi:hypothetical protein
MGRPKKEKEPRGPWTCPTCTHHYDEKPLLEPQDYHYRGRVGAHATRAFTTPNNVTMWSKMREWHTGDPRHYLAIEYRERGTQEWVLKTVLTDEDFAVGYGEYPEYMHPRNSVDGG